MVTNDGDKDTDITVLLSATTKQKNEAVKGQLDSER